MMSTPKLPLTASTDTSTKACTADGDFNKRRYVDSALSMTDRPAHLRRFLDHGGAAGHADATHGGCAHTYIEPPGAASAG